MRLTQSHRNEITKKLMDRAFGKRREELAKKKNTLGGAVYSALYPKAVLTLMEKLPPKAFHQQNYLKVSFGGQIDHVVWEQNKLIFAAHLRSVAEVFDADHPLCQRYRDIEKEQEDLTNKERNTRHEVNAVLGSVSTLAALLKAWPEVRPFCEHLSKNQPPNLPAVLPENLNTLLELPVK